VNKAKLVSIVIALFPVLDVYAFLPGITLGFASVICLAVIFFLKSRNFYAEKDFVIFSIVIVTLHLVAYLFYNHSFTDSYIMLNNLIYLILYVLILSNLLTFPIDKVYLRSTYLIALIATFIAIFQFISFTLKDQLPLFYLPIELKNRMIDQISPNRPSSIFLEPADFAIFLLPVLYVSLIQKKYIYVIIFIIGLILSQSSTAIIGGILVFLYSQLFQKHFIKGFFVISILVTIIIFNYQIVNDLFEASKTLEKLENYENESRLLGNFHILKEMNFMQLFLGLGIGQYQQFANYFSIASYPFVNTILYTVFNCGILGLIVFIAFLVQKAYCSKYKGIIFIFFFLSFTDNLFFSNWMLYLLFFSKAINQIELQNINTCNTNDLKLIKT